MRRRKGITSTLAACLCALLQISVSSPSRAAEPVVRPAVDAIFAAFDKHPLVGLGDIHGLANELAFYDKLVRDPRFAAKVGNVVAEFGASQHQSILDRYLAGEEVPYGELAKVWRNTVAWSPTVLHVGYQTFFAQVRAVNLSLPPDQRIRVLLSEPPIDWSAIHTKEAWQKIYDQRDGHVARVIVREILDRKKKALVIYGSGHFFSYPWPSTIPVPSAGTEILGDIVNRTHPDAFYFISVYGGFEKLACSAALEAEMKWPREVLIAPLKGTPLEKALMPPGCGEPVRGVEPPLPAEENARLEKRFYQISSGVAGDALLYLAPAAELMPSPADATLWMDMEYNREIARRGDIRGYPLTPWSQLVPMYSVPVPRWRQ
jgi:hypothetical protein